MAQMVLQQQLWAQSILQAPSPKRLPEVPRALAALPVCMVVISVTEMKMFIPLAMMVIVKLKYLHLKQSHMLLLVAAVAAAVPVVAVLKLSALVVLVVAAVPQVPVAVAGLQKTG